MNASQINVFQFDPRTVTPAIAQWRLSHFGLYLKAAKDRRTLSFNQRNATLSALVQANPSLEQDLELLAATSDDIGEADATIDMLETIMVQFWEHLAPDAKAIVPRPV